jgi:hypothetical protein
MKGTSLVSKEKLETHDAKDKGNCRAAFLWPWNGRKTGREAAMTAGFRGVFSMGGELSAGADQPF